MRARDLRGLSDLSLRAPNTGPPATPPDAVWSGRKKEIPPPSLRCVRIRTASVGSCKLWFRCSARRQADGNRFRWYGEEKSSGGGPCPLRARCDRRAAVLSYLGGPRRRFGSGDIAVPVSRRTVAPVVSRLWSSPPDRSRSLRFEAPRGVVRAAVRRCGADRSVCPGWSRSLRASTTEDLWCGAAMLPPGMPTRPLMCAVRVCP